MHKFKDDVFECLAHIADFKRLKRSCVRLYKIYVLDQGVKNASDSQTQVYKQKRRLLEEQVNHKRETLSKNKMKQSGTSKRFMN